MKPTEKKPTKKVYQTPQLEDYGTIKEITQAVGQHGADDGGGPPNKKTSL